jgi:hypothetical protein
MESSVFPSDLLTFHEPKLVGRVTPVRAVVARGSPLDLIGSPGIAGQLVPSPLRGERVRVSGPSHAEGMKSIRPALTRPGRGYAGYSNNSISTPQELNQVGLLQGAFADSSMDLGLQIDD